MWLFPSRRAVYRVHSPFQMPIRKINPVCPRVIFPVVVTLLPPRMLCVTNIRSRCLFRTDVKHADERFILQRLKVFSDNDLWSWNMPDFQKIVQEYLREIIRESWPSEEFLEVLRPKTPCNLLQRHVCKASLQFPMSIPIPVPITIRAIDSICSQVNFPGVGGAVPFRNVMHHNYSIKIRRQNVILFKIELDMHW